MNRQPDKLFRNKLEGYQTPAPANTWDKLEAKLDKKNNTGLWLKVAASLMLVAMVAYFLLSRTQLNSAQIKSHEVAGNSTSIPLSDEKIKEEASDVNVTSQLANEKENVAGKKPVQKIPTEKINTDKRVAIQIQSETVQPDNEKNISNAKNQPINSVVEVSTVVASSSISSEPASVTTTDSSTSNKAKTITLVYTVEEVNEKYLDKNALAEATSSHKKPSRLKKLLNKASDLTRDQDPIGELRQKKDEILALNFKRKNNVAKTDKAL